MQIFLSLFRSEALQVNINKAVRYSIWSKKSILNTLQ